MSFSRRTVASVYADYIDDDGTEIDQDLRLRLVPIAFTVRLVPFGKRSPVQPYIGGGLGIISWRYSESGSSSTSARAATIVRDQFVADPAARSGAVVLGGIRFASD